MKPPEERLQEIKEIADDMMTGEPWDWVARAKVAFNSISDIAAGTEDVKDGE